MGAAAATWLHVLFIATSYNVLTPPRCAHAAVVSPNPLLWPIPLNVKCSGEPVCLSPQLAFKSTASSAVVSAALGRYAELVPRPASCASGSASVDTVQVVVTKDDDSLGQKTSYNYTVESSPDGSTVIVTGDTPFGALYGLETLSQLWQNGQQLCAELKVADGPTWPHRGIMLDVGRKFHPLDVLKKVLDGMGFCKLNVLHLHAADFGGVRIESKLYPNLTAHLRNDDGDALYYTHDDIAELISYARLRGVRVIPEIDLPGHSSGWFPLQASHDVVFCEEGGESAVDVLPTQLYDDPGGATVKTLSAYLTELAALFEDEVFHIGTQARHALPAFAVISSYYADKSVWHRCG